MEEMKQEGKKSYGDFFQKLKDGPAIAVCRHCGRVLTDPPSVKAGIGPECAKREADGEPAKE